MKIISLVGARPQFIKEIVVQRELEKAGIKEVLVHSGQHYDVNMSDIFFEVLGIRSPDYFLNVGSGNHGEMTGKIMIEFEKVVLKESPDLIIVYGDTNTTLAGALVGAKLKIPVAHIEAGIRQEPKDMPEEINRVVTDHVSTYLFCPTLRAIENLAKENITKGVYFVGDVMYDVFLMMEEKFKYEIFAKLNLKENEYIVVTLHRDFNVDSKYKLKSILENLAKISNYKRVLFPVHPRTKKKISEFQLEYLCQNLLMIEPVDYLNLMGLVKNSWKVITDSGGLQKEAYFARKQAIVLMPDTGWKELVEYGWNKLANENNLFEVTFEETNSCYPHAMYGEGDAARKVINILKGSIKQT